MSDSRSLVKSFIKDAAEFDVTSIAPIKTFNKVDDRAREDAATFEVLYEEILAHARERRRKIIKDCSPEPLRRRCPDHGLLDVYDVRDERPSPHKATLHVRDDTVEFLLDTHTDCVGHEPVVRIRDVQWPRAIGFIYLQAKLGSVNRDLREEHHDALIEVLVVLLQVIVVLYELFIGLEQGESSPTLDRSPRAEWYTDRSRGGVI